MLTVLTYHRVDEHSARPELDPALISASPETFEQHVAWLARNANPVSLAELLDVRRGSAKFPSRAVLVTFDDAYDDFARHAWPALRRHGVPATLFVATGYPGSPRRAFWWDRLHAALAGTSYTDPFETPAGFLPLATADERARAHRALSAWVESRPHDEAMAVVDEICARLGEPRVTSPVLGWDELRSLASEGVALAPHSRTHPRLDRVSLERAREEIAASRDDLARELGAPCPPAFAFPGGGHDERLSRLLEEEGFEIGFTTCRGPNRRSRPDWLALRRSNVGRRTTLPLLRAQLRFLPAQAMRAVAEARA